VIAKLVPLIDLNPFHWLGDKVKEGLADVFTSMMMALWSAALWLMNLVFSVLDRFLTPDVTGSGLDHLYGVTLWLSLVVALVLGFGQVGLAAVRRDGRTLASLALGMAQYGAVVAGWTVVCGGLIVGCAGLTHGLLSELLHVPGFAGYSASAGMPNQVVGTVQAAGARSLRAVPGDPGRVRLPADHAGARGRAADPGRDHADRRSRRAG
jgi:type IV secretion system protein TrbL